MKTNESLLAERNKHIPQGPFNTHPIFAAKAKGALITHIENNLCLDTSRVFAEGFSMGGSMSYALACEIPDLFAALPSIQVGE